MGTDEIIPGEVVRETTDAQPAANAGGGLLKAMRAEIVAAGLHERATKRILAQLLAHVVLTAVGTGLFFTQTSPPLRALALVVAVLGAMGVASNTHTSLHGGTTDSRFLTELLGFAGSSVLNGLSVTYWRHKHNGLHHFNPNIDGIDPDHEFTPFFALTDSQIGALSKGARRLYRFQPVLFPLATGLLLPNMSYLGAKYSIGELRAGRGSRGLILLDLFGMALSYVLWWGLPLFFGAPVLTVVVFNAGRMILLSYVMFVVFAPAHLPLEAAFYPQGGEPKNFLLKQTTTTLNFRAGSLAGFFISGLQFQIEHHLFPSISHVNYRRVAKIVRRKCLEAGLPYRELGWGEAIWKCVLVGAHPKPVTMDGAGAA